MTELAFVPRNGVNKIDSRILAKDLNIKNHKQWLHDTVIPNQELMKEATGLDLEFDTVKNKRGPDSRFVWLAESQVYFIISISKNTESNRKVKLMMAKKLDQLRNAAAKVKQWAKFKDQIVNPDFELYFLYAKEGDEPLHLSPDFMNGFFSADVVFAEFLEKLEAETGYSLKWDFDMTAPSIDEFTPEQLKALQTYRFISEDTHYNPDGSEHGHMVHMWGEDTLPYLGIADLTEEDIKYQPHGVAWITKPEGIEEAWQNLIQKALYIVEVYNSPELRAEHGIASHEEEATGWWDGPDENCQPLIEILEADTEYNRLLQLEGDFCAYGFQAHKDWIDWLQDTTKQARMARELHLGSPDRVIFESYRRERQYYSFNHLEENQSHYIEKIDPRTKYIHYQSWQAYENGKEWQDTYSKIWEETGIEPATPPLSLDRSLFEHSRVYSNQFRALFGWYLNNIWLPQHSVKFFQTIDPTGYPQLCEAMKALPSNSILPNQFIEAMKPQLAGA